MSEPVGNAKPYVLATAAYNEEALIPSVIASVISQTVRPVRWVIVSDGSTDRTDQIVQHYASRHHFIQLLRINEAHPRDFAAQVNAINAGFAQFAQTDYAFIGNLDADVSFEPSYFAELLDKFRQDPGLGLAGGSILEERAGRFQIRRSNNTRAVAHAVQMFRRECYQSVGGYVPLKYGGPDWHAEIVARMNGWRVQSFPDLRVYHQRPTGTADRLLRHVFRQGCMDYSMGSYPPFEVLKCFRRLRERPFIAGALLRMAGFAWSYCRREERQVSREIVDFLRTEHKARIRLSFSRATAKRLSFEFSAPPAKTRDLRT
jgi:poly-beta-1,6-N-acetyl-D-glucosamine synthase